MLKKALALSVLFGCLAYAQESATSGAKITFVKETHDFETIEKGQKVSVEFEFENSGNEILEIQDVKTSCGCTTAKPEKATYNPGEKGKIPVTFDSTRFNGKITKTITVMSNDPQRPRLPLKITGEIVSEVEVKPAMLSLFNIKRSEAAESEIVISTPRMEKIEVTGVTTDLDFLEIQSVQTDPKNVTIKVKVNPEKASKGTHTFRGNISATTNSKSQKELKIPVNVKFEEPVRVMPRFISFYGTKKGQPREFTVTLTPNGDHNFNILNASTDLEFVSTETTENEDKEKQVKVKLAETVETGKFAGYLIIKTDLVEQPEIRIPVRGSVL